MMENQRYLLKFLDTTFWKSSKKLAAELDCSIRTLRKYVADINMDTGRQIILSSNLGYKLREDIEVEVLFKEQLPQTPYERTKYIIKQLIDFNQEKINIHDLADELYISESTLKLDLKRVGKKLYECDLKLVQCGDDIYLEGLEKNKRKMVRTLLYEESSDKFMNMGFIQKSYPQYNVEFIQYVLKEIFRKYHFYINDYSMINLILYIIIAMDRIDHEYEYMEKPEKLFQIKQHEFKLTEEIIASLEEHYELHFNDSELYELTLLVIGSAINTNFRDHELKNLVTKECSDITERIICEMSENYFLDLSDKDFIYRFTLHMNGLLIRCQNSFFTQNPLTENIRNKCPLIYDYAVNISHIIKRETGYIINDDEIAYLAFHIGSVYENHNNEKHKLSFILLFPQYYDLDISLSDRIVSVFRKDADIKNIITNEEDITNTADFILTTVSIDRKLDMPKVIITPFFNKADQRKVQLLMDRLLIEKKKQKFQSILMEYTKPSLFKKNASFQSREEAIHVMSKQLYEAGMVKEFFEHDVQERENLSSTSFHSVAIPHATKMNAIQTCMNIVLNKEPVLWGSRKVHLIILIAINDQDKKLFIELYEFLSSVLMEDMQLEELLKAKSYYEFIEILLQHI